MPDMEIKRHLLRPGLVVFAVVAIVGIAVVISSLGDEDPPVVTTTPTTTPSGTTAPLRIVPPSTGFSNGPPASIPTDAVAEPVWSREDEWAGTLRSHHGHGILLAPGIVTGVYHEDGTVFAVDMDTGEQLWTTVVSDRSSAALFAIEDGGSVIVGGPGYIAALELATGDEVWRSTFDRSLRPADAVARAGRVYVTLDVAGESTPQVLCLDRSTGGVFWQSRLTGSPDLDLQPGRLALVDGVVAVGVSTGVVGLDAGSGSVVWAPDSGISVPADPVGTPSPFLIEEGNIYAGFDGQVSGLEAETGERVLEVDTAPGRARPLALTDEQLVFTDPSGIHAVGLTDASDVWSVPLEEPRAEVVQDEWIFVASTDMVMAVGRDGDIAWQHRWGAPTGLVVTEGTMVVSDANALTFLDPVSGEIDRSIPLGLSSPMQVRQGRVVVTHTDGSLALYGVTGGGWAPLSEAPITPRTPPQMVWNGSELIAFMEYTGTGSPDAPLVGTAFDPETREWRVLPEPPLTGRYGFVLETIGDEVLLFGGVTDTVRDEETGAILNLESGRWRGMSPTDVANIGEGGQLPGVWTGDLLLVLGYFGESQSLSLLGYEPVSDVWTELGAPPRSMTIGSVTWTDDRLIVWGETDTGFAYDPATDIWEALPAAPIAGRQGHSATWTGEEVIIFGGVDAVGNDRSDGAAHNPETHEWRRIAPGPLEARYNHHAVWSGSEILILGGTVGTNPDERSLKTAAAYDPTTNSWRELPDLPTSLGQMTAAWVPDYGLVLWGSKGGFVLAPGPDR